MNNRPIRRKSNDNPYTLQIINNTYIVIFKDSCNRNQIVEVSKEIFNQFDKFELDDLRELNEYDRHIEHSEIYNTTLNKRAIINQTSMNDSLIRDETYKELINAIHQLSPIQQKRIKAYYFDELNTEKIAKNEKCTQHSIRVSIRRALSELRKILKK